MISCGFGEKACCLAEDTGMGPLGLIPDTVRGLDSGDIVSMNAIRSWCEEGDIYPGLLVVVTPSKGRGC